ncbi:mitochondrial ribosomal protein [Blumeria hordei DH14]|uniref:Mitochondrial ribosomal protein n=1 Tax=Blumeria graminis f. sp. hordei (strain DH14) TaxID=546991 RepID=N1JJD4_BLUG1|nr:mitochondrial ribosomal protein [Blumeria hordei DH14]
MNVISSVTHSRAIHATPSIMARLASSTLPCVNFWCSMMRLKGPDKLYTRSLTTYHKSVSFSKVQLPASGQPTQPVKKIKVYPPPPSPAQKFKEPIKDLTASQIAVLDPTGARTNLFIRTNPEAAKVGDVLLVRPKSGNPFAGVCINIRRRGVDTAILLRGQLTRVGVEMWYKIYSPLVEGIEIIQRRVKRARRERLTYMRKPKHDMGSVQNLVVAYMKAKGAMRIGSSRSNPSGKSQGKNSGKGKK